MKNLQELSKKLTKAQLLDELKRKNIKGGKGCPPPNYELRGCPPPNYELRGCPPPNYELRGCPPPNWK